MILQPRLYAGAFSCVYRRPVNVKHNQEWPPGYAWQALNACKRVPGLCRSWAWVHCVRRSSCPAAWVVRLFVSLCPACVVGRCGAFPGAFMRGCMFIWVHRFPGLWRRFRGLWVHPRRGIDKGRNRAREYAEYPQKIKRPYKR